MCWYSEKLKIKTAKKDIPVWKIVTPLINNSSKECLSLYKGFMYLKDTLITTPIEFIVKQNIIIGNIGFHSYSNKLKLKMEDNAIFIYKKKIFSNFKDYITCQSNTRIARFHIPRGYQYAENKHGEIISSAIVFDGFID